MIHEICHMSPITKSGGGVYFCPFSCYLFPQKIEDFSSFIRLLALFYGTKKGKKELPSPAAYSYGAHIAVFVHHSAPAGTKPARFPMLINSPHERGGKLSCTLKFYVIVIT